MLNLSQRSAIASRYQPKESVFNISNRAPSIAPDDLTSDRDELHVALGRIGCAHIVLKHGRVLQVNPAGRAILERGCGSAGRQKTLCSAVRELLLRASIDTPPGSMSWLAVSFSQDITILVNQTANIWADETCTIVLLDLDARPEPSPRTLQRLFGLTTAETHLAIELARGGNLLDIARSQRLSRTTIRSHLASLFIKTQTRRQAELVSLLGRIAVLP